MVGTTAEFIGVFMARARSFAVCEFAKNFAKSAVGIIISIANVGTLPNGTPKWRPTASTTPGPATFKPLAVSIAARDGVTPLPTSWRSTVKKASAPGLLTAERNAGLKASTCFSKAVPKSSPLVPAFVMARLNTASRSA